MTKIYLVVRAYKKADGTFEKSVTEIFTNKKKALSLIRWYNALDKMDKIKYPNLWKKLEPSTSLVTKEICNQDWTDSAIKREMELLPY